MYNNIMRNKETKHKHTVGTMCRTIVLSIILKTLKGECQSSLKSDSIQIYNSQ